VLTMKNYCITTAAFSRIRLGVNVVPRLPQAQLGSCLRRTKLGLHVPI